jgi:polysaccharide biosynthesis protein PslA
MDMRAAGGMLGTGLADPPVSRVPRALKRIEDVGLTILLLLAATPALLMIGLAVKLDSPGPVLFPQRRLGFNNATFNLLKFRTMRLHCADPDARAQTRRDDARVTRVGRLLRRHSLDELPQLLNVLCGDMSLVGPRPHTTGTTVQGRALEELVDHYIARHSVKPGITGWAQVNGWRGELDSHEKIIRRVEHDLYYIENWSLLFDLKILAKTVLCMLRDRHAY